MVFKKKTAATAEATETVEVAVTATATESKPNLGELIDAFDLQLQGVLTSKMEISDSDLDPQVRDGLAAVAGLIGFEAYDPSGSSLIFVVTDQGTKYLARPSLYAYEDSVCLRWGNQRFVLDSEQALNSDLFTLVGSDDPVLLIDPTGYNLTCPVKIDGAHKSEAVRKDLPTKMAKCRTAQDLSAYLLRGEPRIKWGEVTDEHTISFYSVKWSPSRKDPSKYSGSVLGTLNDEPALFWAPGEISEWGDIPLNDQIADEPLAVVKVGKQVTVGNRTFELKGGNFAKLKELPVGGEYQVTGYSSESVTYDGRSWVDWKMVVLLNGVDTTVSGNAYCKQVLGTNPVITPEEPATLSIDNHVESRDGKIKVVCRLVPAAAKADTLLAKLKAQEEAREAQKDAPVPAL